MFLILSSILTEEINESQYVEHESCEDEEVPYHVGELESSLGGREKDSYRVNDRAGQKEPEANQGCVLVELNDPEDDRPAHCRIDKVCECLADLGVVSKSGDKHACDSHCSFQSPEDCAGNRTEEIDADRCRGAEDREISDAPVGLVHDPLVRCAVLHDVMSGRHEQSENDRSDECRSSDDGHDDRALRSAFSTGCTEICIDRCERKKS